MDADGDTLNIYYGAADCAIALARASVRSLLEWLDANGSCERRQRAQDIMNHCFGSSNLSLACRHRHMSRVFTIKHRTYRVCFDCGREFDLPAPQSPLRSVAFEALREVPSACESSS